MGRNLPLTSRSLPVSEAFEPANCEHAKRNTDRSLLLHDLQLDEKDAKRVRKAPQCQALLQACRPALAYTCRLS
ncbi:hypothetical protein AUP68_09927 [Ilyonectria robusta]